MFDLPVVDPLDAAMKRKRQAKPEELDALPQRPDKRYLLDLKRPRQLASEHLGREKAKAAAEELLAKHHAASCPSTRS
jgi:hypothetical protein